MDFVKLHGTGNDFVVLDARGLDRDWPSLATAMCDRHFGIGGDGLILAAPSERADVRMRIFNADGSEAEMSGNGMRCLVKFAVEAGIVTPNNDEFDVETDAGVLRVRITTRDGRVTSVREGMGKPRLDPRDIPVAIEAAPPVRSFDLQVDGLMLPVTPVSMGNPHAVYFQDADVESYPLHDVGPLVEHHALFPKRTNFEVVRMLGRDRAEMRVWERGVGETLSCGSGASATMVAARLRGIADDALELRVPGGILHLEWDGEGEVILTGPVEESFRGTWPD
ncbi:MAG TPA: diaminopimelate epimerase [Dehalococcoidia bacterium]|jgi:diaminopimelate epimerase|nr:diaminopimelate epimerase [Dehalococcoidia bacterium]